VGIFNQSTHDQKAYLPQPEPGLTPEEIIQRAANLRPLLLEEQAVTEERGACSPEMHERFRRAGFYRILQPKKYGGYEFDLTVFSRVIMEIARGCPGTAWGLSLAAGHALNVAAIFPEAAQDLIFGEDGDFFAPMRAVPTGTATKTDDGWIIDGVWDYCSGSTYSNWALVGVRIIDGSPSAQPKIGTVVIPRAQWELVDNWRGYIGMKASGSNSIRIEKALIPKLFLVEQNLFTLDVAGGTVGYHLHGNPMYSGRLFGFFQTEISSILVGTGFAALDEFERIVKAKSAVPGLPVIGAGTQDLVRPYGIAIGLLEGARNAVLGGAQSYLNYCAAGVKDPSLYTDLDDMRIQAGMQHAAQWAGQAIDLLFSSVGTSAAAKDSTRMQRYLRDISMARTNPGLAVERLAVQIADRLIKERLVPEAVN
jgi:3-hydroxy-9,10-secoandrosta-1,3,5(10)-triene-9,17-dione monooxygenase